jgi:peptidyl-prolyl cis-trans isomerase C
MGRKRASWRPWLAAAAIGLGACAKGAEAPQQHPPAAPAADLELARVGDRSITLKDYSEFYAEVPASLQSSRPGLEKARNHLQTLVDVELLRLEAEARGIEQSADFARKLRRLKQEKLVGLFQVRNLRPAVSDQEVRDYFASQGLSRTVRFSDIVVPSQDSARAALRELARGRSFAEVASKWSMHQATSRRGGDSWVFVNKMEVAPPLREALFSLKVGQVSAPLDLGGAWGIFQASEEKQQELDPHTAQMIYKDLYLKDHIRRRGLLADSLAKAYHLELDRQGLETFLARAGKAADPEELAEVVLYRFDGGTVSGADLMAAVAQFAEEGFDPRDRGAVLAFAARGAVPDALFMEAARRAGLDQEEEVARWLARKRANLLITQLRMGVLEERIAISEEELRAYYEQHPEKFKKLERIEIQEVLVASQEEAERLAQRARQGEPLGELARRHTIRPADQRDPEGRLTLYITYSRALHLDLIRAAGEAEPGDLVGPVETHGGYSVFRVLSRRGEQETFDEARKRVQANVNWIKKQQVFEAFVAELRDKYAAQVQVREDHLKQAFAGA